MENPHEEDEISLLDLLIVVAENIKLLIVGPLLVALCALGISFLLPQKFTSEAIIAFSSNSTNPNPSAALQAAAIMVSPVVLDPVITKLSLAQDMSMQKARQALEKRVKATVGKDGLLRLDATANSPQDAQMLASAIIENWLASTIPAEQEREDMETKLNYAKKGLQSITALITQLNAEGAANLSKPLTRGEAGTGLVAVGELQSKYLNDVLSISRALKGLSKDVIKQSPTLPTEKIAPKKGLITIIAGMLAGFVLLIFVFVRQAWRNSTQNTETAKKKERIRRALTT